MNERGEWFARIRVAVTGEIPHAQSFPHGNAIEDAQVWALAPTDACCTLRRSSR
jgi:hypothetical protein